MRKKALPIVMGLMALGTVAMLGSGCTVTVTGSVDPVKAPPSAPIVSVTCGPNQYLRGGKHVWRNGAYRWVAPRCVTRTATWRAGCRWTRGHWVRSGRKYIFRAGRLSCPRRVIRVVGPTARPPAPPVVRVTCAGNQYLKGGKHVWRGGRWVWVAPRCVARTTTWRAGCVWRRGGWKRVGKRLRYTAGRLFCPKFVPLRVVHPVMLPPTKPPKTYRRIRCGRGKRYYPGRYVWNNGARQYVWRGGRCITTRRGCRWVKGRWTVHNGRSYYVRPAWRCRGKLSYVGYKGTWKPGKAYGAFIKRRPCGRNRYRAANGRCMRYKRRCPAGFMLRRGRCFKRRVFKRCGRGWVLRAGRCYRKAVRVPACRAGFRRVGTRCIKNVTPRRCRPGFILRGRKCVKARRPIKRCRVGFALRGRKCVKIRRPIKKCRVGFALRGRKCVKIRRPIKKCRRGFTLRGRRCVKLARPVLKCRRGFVLRGRKCVKAVRPKLKCRKGFKLRGRKCIKVTRPIKKCRRGFVLRGRRCVKRR